MDVVMSGKVNFKAETKGRMYFLVFEELSLMNKCLFSIILKSKSQ